MRIAIVVSTFPPYQGGMGNMARSYAVGLTHHGHNVAVFCPAGRRKAAEPPAPYAVHRLKPWGRIRNSAFLPQLSVRLARFDLVNLHYPFYGGAESVLLNKRLRGSRQSLVLNFQMDNFGAGLTGLVQDAYQKFLLPSMLGASDRVIVTSLDYAAHSSVAGFIRRYPEKIAAIPPGVDTGRFRPGPKTGELRMARRIAPNHDLVLFVGGLDQAHAFKGIGFLLETWARMNHPHRTLAIVGRGNLREGYIRKAAALGLAGSVVFDDSVGEADLPSLYREADLVVLPSLDRSEAFGIVLIEALASGVPIVAADLPGVRSVVEVGKTGYTFNVGDTLDLAAKINLCLRDKSTQSRMAAAARVSALARFQESTLWEEINRIMIEAGS